MHIQSIEIVGVAGIDALALTFDPMMNIVCGPNGIGKTTILEAVAHAFSAGQTNVLKRNVRANRSRIEAVIEVDGQSRTGVVEFQEFVPNRRNQINGFYDLSKMLLSLKINRTFEYKPLEAVGRDPNREDHTIYSAAQSGISLQDVKNWFVNRYLYSAHQVLSPVQVANFELAKSSFSALNSDFRFSRVDPSTNEILVESPTGEVYYEYLSSGFKSCLSIIFGIVKEIEFRFSDPGISALEFDGIILIDEIELHLHPEWQARILPVLSQKFPKAQFICTTHSAHVIQAAEAEQIIAIESDEGVARQRALPESKFGFKGWSVEEVLTDVMGMRDLRTDAFKAAITAFEEAVDNEDAQLAIEAHEKLDAMLHPQNVMRKMFSLQLKAMPGAND